jgi:hypothetical protein
MIKNGDSGIGKSAFRIEAIEAISVMLECLLNKDKMKCKKCKSCEEVDVCCFLMESVIVYQHKEMRKTGPPSRFNARQTLHHA